MVALSGYGTDTAGLYAVWVAPLARGCGAGDALMEAALAEAAEAGYARIVLDLGDYNEPAQALYARFGFEPTGRRSTLPPPRQHIAEHELPRALGETKSCWRIERSSMISEADVRQIAMSLPGAYEQPSYEGCPSWRTKPKIFAWLRGDPEALVVWVDSLDTKEALVAFEPEVFFTTSHYDGHAIVLVRLDAVDAERARSLITDSWRLRAPASLVKAAADRPRRGAKKSIRPGSSR